MQKTNQRRRPSRRQPAKRADPGSTVPDPAAGLSVLHVVVRASATNSQYNEHCLPVMRQRNISVCSLFPAEVAPPPQIRLVEGDGSVLGCFRALRKALAEAAYDVVHVHAAASGMVVLLVYLRLRRSRRDLVFTVHSSWSNFRPRNRLFLLAIAALFPVLVVCGQSAAATLPWWIRILARRLEVIPNGVDIARVDHVLSRTAPSRRRTRAGLDVVSVGRLMAIKAPATLMEAFAGAAGPQNSLVLVGDGPLHHELSKAVEKAGLGSRIRFTGVLPRDEVYRVLDRAGLFVSASTVEGLPVAVLEAMACRCPVILSDIPPHREIARLTPAIRLVPVGDVAGFRDAMAQLLRMPQPDRQSLGDQLRRCVVQHFSVSAMGAAYGRVYREVARRNAERAAPATPRARGLVRLVAWSAAAAALGAFAALGYGATHRAGYVATTTLEVGDTSTSQIENGTDVYVADAATVMDLVDRQVVLEPVARSLGLGNWRALQRRVHSERGDDPLYVDVRVTATSSRAAELLADAVADRVVQLTATVTGPSPDPAFTDRELARVDGEIASTQAQIEDVLHQLGSAGPAATAQLGRTLTALRGRLTELQDTSRGMADSPGQTAGSRGASVEDVAYPQRESWPPGTTALAALGAAAGLCTVLAATRMSALLRSAVDVAAPNGGASDAQDMGPRELADLMESEPVETKGPTRSLAPAEHVGSLR